MAAGAAVAVGGPQAGVLVLLLAVIVVVLSRLEVDAVTALIVVVVALLVVPARLRLGPLGAAGTPGSLVGAGAFAVWAWGRLWGRRWLAPGRQPLRVALLLAGASLLASYVLMGFRPHDLIETKAADRGLITFMGLAGVALLAADGVSTRERLRTLVKAIVAAGAVLASLGIVQFMVRTDLAAMVRLPGFTFDASNYDAERSGFSRIVSTTSHPIEMSVVLGILLPLALHVAFGATGRYRAFWWVAAGTIGTAIPMTVSRTAVVGLVVCGLILLPAWDSRRRRIAIMVAAVGVVAMRFAVPGLLGTLRSLIFNYGADPSIASRKSDYDYVTTFIAERPLFGRGLQTFLPTRYAYLDNQLLLGLVEVGLVGTVLLIGVHLVAVGQARAVRRESDLDADRDLALCLIASISVSLVSWLTYDALSFPTSRILTFVCIGCAAALWRLHRWQQEVTMATAAATTGSDRSPRLDHRAESAGTA
jgi:polysaccharide biosynthesis protein PslJ